MFLDHKTLRARTVDIGGGRILTFAKRKEWGRRDPVDLRLTNRDGLRAMHKSGYHGQLKYYLN